MHRYCTWAWTANKHGETWHRTKLPMTLRYKTRLVLGTCKPSSYQKGGIFLLFGHRLNKKSDKDRKKILCRSLTLRWRCKLEAIFSQRWPNGAGWPTHQLLSQSPSNSHGQSVRISEPVIQQTAQSVSHSASHPTFTLFFKQVIQSIRWSWPADS